jgi:hypothetical protein
LEEILVETLFSSEMGRKKERDQSFFYGNLESEESEVPPKKHSKPSTAEDEEPKKKLKWKERRHFNQIK